MPLVPSLNVEIYDAETNLDSGRCIFHHRMQYIFPDDSNRVRIHFSGRVAPGIFKILGIDRIGLKTVISGVIEGGWFLSSASLILQWS